MRILALLLVLANLILFAYFNADQWLPAPAVKRTMLNPEKVKILNNEALEKIPKKAVAPAQVAQDQPATACYKWGDFTTSNLAAAQVVLVRLGLQADVNQALTNLQDKRFWVYYPPLKSTTLAQQKADEIRALGVDDLYVVQDAQWRNAISFGLFNEEKLASNLLASLRAKGVKGVIKALRSAGNVHSSLLVKNVNAESALALYKIKPEFVGTEVTPVACPA